LKLLDVSHAPIAHAPGPSYQDILDLDTGHEIPAALRYRNTVDLGVQPYRADRYTSVDFFHREVEKVWLKSWQFACREEEIARPGDTYIYEIVGRSLLVTRQCDGSIKAFLNVCLHRGRKLVNAGGCKDQFRCPYHGMTWNNDGSFKANPFEWDFPQIDAKAFSLPEAQVARWAGFVFVNFDREAAPLLDLIGDMPAHFDHWRIEDCYKAVHVAKMVPANWKACAEAFLEGHHVAATHPQALPFIACERTQYDLLTDHVTRFAGATGITGGLWEGPPLSEEQLVAAMLGSGSRAGKPGQTLQAALAPGETSRSYMANIARTALETETGYDFSHACDADVLDAISYDIFPNFHLWGGFPQKICYRFRPAGMNHEQTLLEVMLFKIKPKDTNPPPARMRMLGVEEPWAIATELGYLAGIFDQDQSNLAPIQDGLRNLGGGDIQFSRYQEMRCRNLHRMIDMYMSK
jgi:phenylpropionate dioxygenase-like ring-hydroxylating dioxygenase large terminal subunit